MCDKKIKMTEGNKKKIRHKKFRNRPAQITANIVPRGLIYNRNFTLTCVEFDETYSRWAVSCAESYCTPR